MTKNLINISDESVQKATGKIWDQWVAFLDDLDGQNLTHKELVNLLEKHGEIESEWWRQSVTVGYEKLKGKRVVGQTKDTGFQVGAQKTLPLSGEQAWDLLISPNGVRIWLGDADGLTFEKGERYQLSDGSGGEMRVVRPQKHARLTYKPEQWAKASTIQVRVETKADKTVIGFHEENLPGVKEREERRKHFRAALGKLDELSRTI
ncbi:MAG: SRPBCC domain-containing protein [Balneolales bacterium]